MIRSPHPAPYAVASQSIGWLVVGASTTAASQVIPAMRQLPSTHRGVAAWVAGVHSQHAGRAHEFAIRHHIPHASDDLTELLRRPEVRCVYVGNHPRNHAESVRAALIAGKHVLCEAPIALDLTEAEELVKLAHMSDLCLGVNYLHRTNSVIEIAKQLLQEGVIGELLGGAVRNTQFLDIRQRSWRLQANGGGVLFCHTLHDIDLLRSLLDEEIVAIQTNQGHNLFTSNLDEETWSIVYTKRLHLRLHLHDAFLLPHLSTQLELYGANGVLTLQHCFGNSNGTTLEFFRNGERQPLAYNDHARERTPPLSNMLQRFHQALAQALPLPAAGEEDNANLAVVLGGKRSLQQSGRRVELFRP
jgi:1,5-anhydro-D-fructose reductase (1,5-anhydro-D-mannitol-forming)